MSDRTTDIDELRLLTAEQAAEMLSATPRTLQSWRSQRINLPFLKISGLVRYQRSDVLEFLANSTVRPVRPGGGQ